MNYALLVLDIVTKVNERTTNAKEKPGVSSPFSGNASPIFNGMVIGALIPSELTALTQIVWLPGPS